jgi:hypothetical protein
MKKERRWIKAAIAASNDVQIVMPWHRAIRKRPAALVEKLIQPTQRAVAAR